MLDGTGRGPVLNVAVMSNVAPTYAPAGRHLVVAAMPGHIGADIEDRRPSAVAFVVGTAGRHVAITCAATGSRTVSRASARPSSPSSESGSRDGRFVCGDHRDTASIQGAMFSGRRCGLEVAAAIGQTDDHD